MNRRVFISLAAIALVAAVAIGFFMFAFQAPDGGVGVVDDENLAAGVPEFGSHRAD